MSILLAPFNELIDIKTIKEGLRKTKDTYGLSGCPDELKPLVCYAFSQEAKFSIIICADELRAKEMYEVYRSFDDNTCYFPAKDMLFYQSDISGNALSRQRMTAIEQLLMGEGCTVITTLDALMNKLPPIKIYEDNICILSEEGSVDLDELRRKFTTLGYEYVGQVEHPGEFSVRGGIIDVFPLTATLPVRVELWGDEVDSIRSFSPESQKSIEKLNEAIILPAVELPMDPDAVDEGLAKIQKDLDERYSMLRDSMETEKAFRLKSYVDRVIEETRNWGVTQSLEAFLPYFYSDTSTLADYLPKGTCVLIDEPGKCINQAQHMLAEFSESMMRRVQEGYVLSGQADMLVSVDETCALLDKFSTVVMSTLDYRGVQLKAKESFSLRVSSVNSYNGSYELLVKDLKKYKKNKFRMLLATDSSAKAKRLAQELDEEGFAAFFSETMEEDLAPGAIMVVKSPLTRGFEFIDSAYVFLSDSDIYGHARKKSKKKKADAKAVLNFSDLHVGDYVVHESYGLGIYKGMEQIEHDHIIKDYLKIEYAKGGNLYVLSSSLDAISKYSGPEGKKPKLNTLGTAEWKKTKEKVVSAVGVVAKELVELYAARQSKDGFVYGADTVWQKEFEESFPYEETQGQMAAIDDVKADMMSAKIMDRLICGDVGYGKTEVAIRAAFKAVQENKQVVYLVPTTILAQQHYNTFVQRMGNYPVKVDLLCRFRTPNEQKKTIEKLKSGAVDIVIGTHRLLSKDVGFANLGLLIIDEEQRFGVTHKEKIKQLKNTVDVMSLSATPIPRTLHMSLIGIRDMSVLDEAPMERMPIQTFVFEYNEEMVREAISREMARGGQVYYVYNRVATIADVAARLEKLMPEANIAYAHGKMNETQLEDIMLSFINHEIDVLVATTIIEIGMDISNVNTIIIHDADNLGLSQLYQLRGRVGRSNRTAYAFLMYKRDKMLKEVAEKRLAAIKEFTDLGSGFKIAMRDLEIRGAGNILGAEQHGHMALVGYDMYCKLLSEAVLREKGELKVASFNTTVDIDIEAYIPPSYISSEEQRIDIYKRIALIATEEEKDEMLDELIDRFGEPRKAVLNLLRVAMIRAKAHASYITEIDEKNGNIRIAMFDKAPVDVIKLPEFIESHKPVVTFQPDPTAPTFVYHTTINSKHKGNARFEYLETFIEELHTLIDEEL